VLQATSKLIFEDRELLFSSGTTNNLCVRMLWKLYNPWVHGNCSLISNSNTLQERPSTSASSLDLLSLSHLPWVACRDTDLNWLFTTSMSSSSSTETSISSSLNIQWKHIIHNHLTCCFASETLLSHQSISKSCPQHYVTRMKLCNKLVPVSWPFLDENWAVFSAKIMAKFLFWRT